MSTEVTHPGVALTGLLDRIEPVDSEVVPLGEAHGRVLAEPLVADRDSPPNDVSAMDGYAVRLSDLANPRIPVAGEIVMGAPAPLLPEGKALRIVTGACVPAETEAIVMREDVSELDGAIELRVESATIRPGQHIRRRGENLRAGTTVLDAGALVSPAVGGGLATFGAGRVSVRRKVLVSVLVTGDELLSPEDPAEPWQIRDANGPAALGVLGALPWVKVVRCDRVRDSLDVLTAQLVAALSESDALVLTGGVSMGQHDYVPAALERAGGQILFHRLPVRPGKPVLGGLGPWGQPVLGLPGNPVSVLVSARWFGVPVLRRRAGLSPALAPAPLARLREHDGKTLHLWWFRPVRLTSDGEAELTPSLGSGDMVSAARSDGFVLIPPHEQGPGPWPFYGWTP